MTIDKKIILESIEKIMPIADEMGEDRFKQYMKVYLEENNMESTDLFFVKFANYIEQCKLDKMGFKRISLFSFKLFLKGLPPLEELEQIWSKA